MPRKKKQPRKKPAVDKSKDARMWQAQKGLLQAMHKSLIQKEEGKNLNEFETNLVEGMGAIAEGKFEEAYRALEMMVREDMDPHVFAIADVDEKRGVYRRVYSSRPDEFPVTGDRPIPSGLWAESILKKRKLMVSNNLTAMAKEIPDSAEGLAMGCQSFSYMPIAGDETDSELLGVIILMAKKDFFHDKNVRALADKNTHFWIYMNALSMARRFDPSSS